MAIRFACPSCRQPIEIDDQWAGQSVACPYCRNVVTAPSASSWPAGEVPTASPAGGQFAAPPPPPGMIQTAPRGRSAGWALTLAITSAVLSLVAYVSLAGSVAMAIRDKVGDQAKPAPEEIARHYQEMLMAGTMPTSPLASAAVLIGLLCAIGGLALGVTALVRRDPRRITAIIACAISVLFLFCQLMLGSLLVVAASGHPMQ